MKNKLIEIIATGFYLGMAPKAPGTFGTLLGIPLAFGLYFLGPYGYMIATFLLILLAIFVSEFYVNQTGVADNQRIVIDEVVGYLVAFTWLPLTWQSFVFAFVLFRILDASKPFPINFVDEKIKGGLGVVTDDIVAGLVTNMLLQVIYSMTDWLGVQLIP